MAETTTEMTEELNTTSIPQNTTEMTEELNTTSIMSILICNTSVTITTKFNTNTKVGLALRSSTFKSYIKLWI